jgi:hypothetical protein
MTDFRRETTVYVLTHNGREWGYFTAADLREMGYDLGAKNVRAVRTGALGRGVR